MYKYGHGPRSCYAKCVLPCSYRSADIQLSLGLCTCCFMLVVGRNISQQLICTLQVQPRRSQTTSHNTINTQCLAILGVILESLLAQTYCAAEGCAVRGKMTLASKQSIPPSMGRLLITPTVSVTAVPSSTFQLQNHVQECALGQRTVAKSAQKRCEIWPRTDHTMLRVAYCTCFFTSWRLVCPSLPAPHH